MIPNVKIYYAYSKFKLVEQGVTYESQEFKVGALMDLKATNQ